MTDSIDRSRHWPAVLWLLLALVAGWHGLHVLGSDKVSADLFAMLPAQGESSGQREALQRAAAQGSANIVVLLGLEDDSDLASASDAFRHRIEFALPRLHERAMAPAQLAESLRFYQPYRQWLLTPAQRQQLASSSDEQLAQRALARLLQPVDSDLLPWSQDPLALAGDWWRSHAPFDGVEPGVQGLRLQRDGRHWAVLVYQLDGPAFNLAGDRALGRAFEQASAEAQTRVPGLEVLYAGVPLHADAAAAQAAWEMSTIGFGSLFAVLALVWAAFRSLRPLWLVALSLLIGCAVGLSVTVLVFGEVHLLTLVFGASLVGVAEDYGIHYFAARQAQPAISPLRTFRQLRPGLRLALATSALAYLALGILPFPGLRQMAVFSASGLAAAYLTVALWFPQLDRAPPRRSRLGDRLGASLQHLPAFSPTTGACVAVAILVVCGFLLKDLRASDDLRQLQGSPVDLVDMQLRAGKLLGLPSPAQFFLVEGEGAEQLLQREEALVAQLQPLRDEHLLAGWTALSDWVPSQRTQQASRARVERVERLAVQQAAALMGTAEPSVESSTQPLDAAAFAASPIAAQASELVFGLAPETSFSVVKLRGVSGVDALQRLAAAAHGLAGVRWVDRTADYTRLLRNYRMRMSAMLVLGFVLVGMALLWRFGRRGWRALLPTALAAVISLAALTALGQPIYLFNVLALLLLLGIGVDYGIFLLEHNDGAAWMAVALGAASTLLAFGLLGLSATPALRAFGLTLLFGVGAVWLLSPLYRPSLPPSTVSEPNHA